MRLVVVAVCLAAASGAATGTAHADQRALTFTYEYMTMPEGQTELELWSISRRAEFGGDSPEAFELQLEVEHGITSHWDIALYHVFTQFDDPVAGIAQPLALSEIKLESRYRLGERGAGPVDTTLYFEGVKAFAASVYEVEVKGIFSKDFGRLTAVANVIAEVEFGGDVGEVEFEPGWAAGAVYELSPVFKVGAEMFGAIELEEGEVAILAGPAFGWSPSPNLWVSATAAFGVVEADAFTLQAVIGLGL